MKINEVIVVEGKSDTEKIKRAVEADTIETNGSAISTSTLHLIAHANEKRGVIIFTDPDYPGNRIRRIITEHVSGCKHAFLAKEEAVASTPNKSVGIEHASIEAIQKALKNVHTNGVSDGNKSDIVKIDLIHYGLIGHPHAQKRRELLGKRLHIGMTNGKQLLKRLYMFQITKHELDLAMKHILIKGEERNE